MKKVAMIVFLSVIILTKGHACDCDWMGDFFQASKRMGFIVKVKILNKSRCNNDFDEKMNVDILKVFKGVEKKSSIVVWGDNGMDCRPYISYFEEGECYYLALNKFSEDYEQISCGELYLKISDDKVMGNSQTRNDLPQISGMSIVEFEQILSKK